MIIRLGYVAISLVLNITASKTITYTNYNKIGKEAGYKKLDILIRENFAKLKEILKYNYKNHIHFYRLSHNLIPLATHHNVDFDYLKPYQQLWQEIGNLSKQYDIRLDTHPDQFCVLNSPRQEVVQNSIVMLEFHQQIFHAMQIDGKAVLHVGGCFNNKEKAIKTFIRNFKKLDQKIQNIIILENDDKVFGVKDVLYICETLNIPMVLDYHHYKCHNDGEDLKEYLPRILATWSHENLRPKMHFSSPKSKKEFRSHSDYIDPLAFIDFLELLRPFNTDIDIMLECKAKDYALFTLIAYLKYKTNYHFLDETTFKV